MLRSEPTEKRIRAYVHGQPVVDTRDAHIVWFGPVARTYAVPLQDIQGTPGDADGTVKDPIAGRVPAAALHTPHGTLRNALLAPREGLPDGRLLLNWTAMDAWYEEDDPVHVHPHDPHHRIDVRASSRHVEIIVDDQTVAESRHPTLLFETGLPVRYYLPPLDVRQDLLDASGTKTACAYKGHAEHRNATIGDARHDDVAWLYPAPFAEAQKIEGLIAFYQERVDMRVDGEALVRPDTPWRR